jgi:hypothetical protein
VAKLAEVSDRDANVEDSLFADIGVAADADLAGMDAIAEGRIARHDGASRNDRIVADPKKIRRHRHGARCDDRIAADPGAEQTQVSVVERRADEGVDGRRADDQLRRPEAEIGKAPQRD